MKCGFSVLMLLLLTCLLWRREAKYLCSVASRESRDLRKVVPTGVERFSFKNNRCMDVQKIEQEYAIQIIPVYGETVEIENNLR